ncbi:hypothetical protein EDC04DRAFT_3136286 [Pisolithus marmoratus]|nr:hypothetical protein EDC04DRAFT_3136286 [Pisolithus marmoratus]
MTQLRTGVPPEVWDHIFDIATHVPYTLTPEIFEKSALIGIDYNKRYHPALKAALVTKRTLVLVCKQWWHLAIRYLYRAIFIDKARHILSLCTTLQNYASGRGTVPGTGPLGWWAERLDVEVHDADTDEERLADIIMCLPNLEIASLDIGLSLEEDLALHSVRYALRHTASSLRVLDWSMWPRDSDPATLLAERCLLAELPRLCILRSRCMPWTDGLIPQNILSSITTLAVDRMRITPGGASSGSGVEKRRASLREVIINTHREDLESWTVFMGLYGVFLHSVHLNHCDNYQNKFFRYLAMIKRSCPNIRRLTFSLIGFRNLTDDVLSLPPIEYLGLSMFKLFHNNMNSEALFSVLVTLRDTLPSLRVVQLTEPLNVSRLLTRHYEITSKAMEDLAGCAFRVEDDDGNLLFERLQAIGVSQVFSYDQQNSLTSPNLTGAS